MAMFGLFTNQQSKLGYLSLDVLVNESLSLPSDVTKYPIEDGSGDFTDHITRHNEELKINGMISAATSFGVEFGPLCYSKLVDAVSQLRAMHKARQPITIVTGLGKYTNMAFTDLTIDRSNSSQTGGQWLNINAGLRQIVKVALRKADLPPAQNASSKASGKAGQTEKKAGQSGTSDMPAGGSMAFSGTWKTSMQGTQKGY